MIDNGSADLVPVTPFPVATELDREAAAWLRRAADEHLAAQRPANTIDAYAQDWQVWTEFCAEQSLSAFTPDPNLLVAFVVWMEHTKGYAPSTMVRRLAGTAATMRDHLGLDAVPKGLTERASRAVAGYDRRLRRANIERGRGEAQLITTTMLVQMVQVQPETLIGLRNRSLLLMWYHLGSRGAELSELLVTDVKDDGDVLLPRLRDSKTGEREPVVTRKPGSPLCPVAAWYTWLAASGISEGPAYPRMNRHGHLLGPMTRKSVGTVVTTAGRAAGFTVRVTGHGMRAGHITTAMAAGADPKKVGLQTGHKPEGAALWRYRRRVERAVENTSSLIDLD